MKYTGIQTQKERNNFRSMLLLCLFPFLLFGIICAFFLAIGMMAHEILYALPFVLLFVAVWFSIAYFTHSMIIRKATKAKPIERRSNMRVYNLMENLCISCGMSMPKLEIINSPTLNAYASGINSQTYAVTLTDGIVATLNDEELEGVIAHELSHIRNNDTRLMIITTVFVGIFSIVGKISLWTTKATFFLATATDDSSSKKDKEDSNSSGCGFMFLMAILMSLFVAALSALGKFISMLMDFAISRKREYLADASAAQMTQKPKALASALRKISNNPEVETVKDRQIARLFIEKPIRKKSFFGFYETHPPIMERIAILEQF